MGWALLGASSLLLGALVAFAVRIPRKVLGFILAFGSGVLTSAVAYELVEEAVTVSANSYAVGLGFVVGALVFFVGDVAIDRWLKGSSGGGLGIVLGAVLDGIPESVVIGASLLTGETASVAVIVAVFLSNIPESISASSDAAFCWSSATKRFCRRTSGCSGLSRICMFRSSLFAASSWAAKACPSARSRTL